MDAGNKKKEIHSNQQRIFLQDNNMDKYGFSRFYYPEEKKTKENIWLRLITGISDEVSSQPETEIVIPDHILIPLSRDPVRKLALWNNFYVDEVKDHVDHLKMLSKRAGWNQTEQDLKRMIRLAKNSNFLAKVRINGNEIPLGSGVVIKIGKNIYWIGMILVHPEVRRQGIATALMYFCLKESRFDNRQKVIGLDATPKGKKLYDLLGFRESFRIWRCLVPANLHFKKLPTISIEPFTRLSTIDSYLLHKGFDDRRSLFSLLLKISSGRCFVALIRHHIVGFVMSRPGAIMPYIGPLIADDVDIAAVLLGEVLFYWKDLKVDQVLMDVPSHHLLTISDGLESEDQNKSKTYPMIDGFLKDFEPRRSFDRMYHLVSEENKGQIYDFLMNEFNVSSKGNEFLKVLKNSEKSYGKTMAYMEKEKNELINYQYAICGPEFS